MQKIIIIGGGPAGLSCAYHLLKKKKYQVTVIEEAKQVGGISKTINYKGNYMDIGGHRFFTKNELVKNFWFDILPLNNEKDERLEMLIRNRVSRIYYNKKFFDYPINLSIKTIKNLGFNATMKCGFSYLKSSLFKLKEVNLENFYINRFGRKLYELFFKEYTTKVWGRSPSEIDSSWGSQRVKGISIRKVLEDYFKRLFHIKDKHKEVSLIEKFFYPKYGPGELYEEVARQIEEMGGKVILNAKVTKLVRKDNQIKELEYVKGKEKETIKGDIIVSSMPLVDLINGMNDVPKKVLDVSNNLPYRSFTTIGILISKNNFLQKDIKDNWIYIQEPNIRMGRIQIFNNWSPYLVKNAKTMWLGLEYFCMENDDFWNSPDKELVQLGVEELKKMKLIKNDILDSHVIRVKKAYPAYFDSYKELNVIKKYLNKIDNLYCIGRNGTHSYNNMDHSILSGIVCSDMIIRNKHDVDKLWDINVDSSYQEEK